MTPTEPRISHKVLLVDDDEAIREMMTATLAHKGFDVVAAANVTEALKLITTKNFDVLITDLHMPNPSDGFAVITAMRHIQPKALTLLVSGYRERLFKFVEAQNVEISFSERIAPAKGLSYGGKIKLLSGMQPAEEFSTLVHEIAHEMLHRGDRRTLTTKQVRETDRKST